MKTALILFAHGARDPEWANPMRRVQAAVQARQPGVPVELAFLEFMSPTLSESIAGLLAGGVRKIVVMPMFIARGGHLDERRRKHRHLELRLFQNLIDIASRRCLAVRPRHRNDPQMLGRIAIARTDELNSPLSVPCFEPLERPRRQHLSRAFHQPIFHGSILASF